MKTTNIKSSVRQEKVSSIPLVQLDKIELSHAAAGAHHKSFHLGPLSLQVNKGEVLAIVGPSGSGKTTLLRLIAGLERAKKGRMSIDGASVQNDGQFVPAERRAVGMVFQDHALFPHLTIRHNILFGIRHWARDDRERRLYELESLIGLKDHLSKYPHQLSGGQQQRVALARTLAQNPKLILLDEPLSNMDADLRENLAQELKDILQKTHSTAIWVTHDQSEALDLADRIIVMNHGKIEQVDTPWNLYNNPKTRFVADFIGQAVFLPAHRVGKSIVTEVGTVDCPPCLNNTDNLEIMLRPDDVIAQAHDAGNGEVIKRQFLGAIQLYTIQLPSQHHILTYQAPQINWPLGTTIRLSLNVKTVVAFPVK